MTMWSFSCLQCYRIIILQILTILFCKQKSERNSEYLRYYKQRKKANHILEKSGLVLFCKKNDLQVVSILSSFPGHPVFKKPVKHVKKQLFVLFFKLFAILPCMHFFLNYNSGKIKKFLQTIFKLWRKNPPCDTYH